MQNGSTDFRAAKFQWDPWVLYSTKGVYRHTLKANRAREEEKEGEQTTATPSSHFRREQRKNISQQCLRVPEQAGTTSLFLLI